VGRFEQLRDRLPTLYRPDADDTAEEPLPLRADDVIDMFCEPPQVPRLVSGDRQVIVNLDQRALLREVRLASGSVPGQGYALEALALEPDAPPGKGQTVAGLDNGIATFTDDFWSRRFAIRLKRRGLLTLLLRAIADVLEDVNSAATNVMQAHWFEYADRARFSPYYVRARQIAGLPPADPIRPVDRFDMDQFPFIADLARLGSLLAISPWPESTTDVNTRDLVEPYRERIRRIVEVYTQGLGTVGAIRAMIEALGLVDVTAPAERRDRGIWLEEFAPAVRKTVHVPTDGPPFNVLGPLMRWTLSNTGLAPVAPTVYIQGVTPEPDLIDATTDPIIELYARDGHPSRVGLAYRGTIEPGQTLRLQPTATSWIGLDQPNGLQTSTSATDPTAPGPWASISGPPVAFPSSPAVAILQAQDYGLWVATNTQSGSGALRRFDGTDWHLAVANLPTINCVAEDASGQKLQIGTGNGLLRMPLFPTGVFATEEVASMVGQQVLAQHRASDGKWWFGTSTGLWRLAADDALESAGLPVDTAVHAIAESGDALVVGTDLGLFEYHASAEVWFWYAGEEFSETDRDWVRLDTADATTLPSAERIFLPPVTCVCPASDTSVWLGTERGIARYFAQPIGELGFTTLLEAFPDLTDGSVFSILEDERGVVWFATSRGLFRFDGRDFWQFQSTPNAWVQLGRADRLYDPLPRERGAWRFVRARGTWQRHALDVRANWEDMQVDLRGAAETAVHAIAWTDTVHADLGSWNGSSFTPSGQAPGTLEIRFKPDEQHIRGGGIPGLPRLPVGSSVWRYLTIEPPEPDKPDKPPAWTCEGRLLAEPAPALDREPAYPGRFDLTALDLRTGDVPAHPQSAFDKSVFAFHPAARVWFTWQPRQPLTLLARLKQRQPNEQIDAIVLDRVWQGIQQVRPAGVRVMLAVEDAIVRGQSDG
jgi:two component regulator with propeller domain